MDQNEIERRSIMTSNIIIRFEQVTKQYDDDHNCFG